MTSWNAAQAAQDNYSAPVARKDLGVMAGSEIDRVGYDHNACKGCGYMKCSCPVYGTGLAAEKAESYRSQFRKHLEESNLKAERRRNLYWLVIQLLDGKTVEYTQASSFSRQMRVRDGQFELRDSGMRGFTQTASFASWFARAEDNGYGKPDYKIVKSEP